MNNKLLLCVILLFFPLWNIALLAQDEDEDESPIIEIPYQTVTNDHGLVGLMRTADKKMVIPFQHNKITLDGTPASIPLAYVNMFDSLNNEGIYSLKDKKLIIPCKYSRIEKEYRDFYPNDEKSRYEFCGFQAIYSDGGSTATDFYASNGKKIISTTAGFDLTPFDTQKNLYLGIFQQGYFLFNAKLGTLIQKHDYPSLELIPSNNMFIVTNQGNKYGLVNAVTGNYVISAQYDSLYDVGYIGLIARKGNTFCVVHDDGKMFIPPGMYDAIYGFNCAHRETGNICCLTVLKNGKWGCVDDRNKPLIPFLYDAPFDFSNIMWVSKNHQWGAISCKGTEVAPFVYDSILFSTYDNYDKWDSIFFDYYSVRQNGKWGCVHVDGKNILPVEYDRAVEYYDTMWVSKGGKWGCIDKEFNQLVDFKFDTSVYGDFKFSAGGISCTKSKKPIQLSSKGEEIHVKTLLEAVNTNDKETFLSQIGTAGSREKGVALFYAIYNNNMEMFRLLMKNKPDVNFVYDSKPPIYHVALLAKGYGRAKTSFEMLSSLIAAGADPNQRGFSGDTPLMAYVSSNYSPRVDFVKALLRAGAKVSVKNDYGDDVYDKLTSSSTSDEIKDLLKQNE
jgi:hypothetical protein